VRRIIAKLSAIATVIILPLLGATAPVYAQQAAPDNFRIVNVSSGQKLIPSGYGAIKNDDFVVWANLYEELPGGKRWTAIALGNGYYQFRNADTRKCLAVGKYQTGDGKTAVVQKTCNEDWSQQWSLPIADSGHLIISRSENQALVPYLTNQNAWAVLEDRSGASTQVWKFVKD
jgi:hypothetical protein